MNQKIMMSNTPKMRYDDIINRKLSVRIDNIYIRGDKTTTKCQIRASRLKDDGREEAQSIILMTEGIVRQRARFGLEPGKTVEVPLNKFFSIFIGRSKETQCWSSKDVVKLYFSLDGALPNSFSSVLQVPPRGEETGQDVPDRTGSPSEISGAAQSGTSETGELVTAPGEGSLMPPPPAPSKKRRHLDDHDDDNFVEQISHYLPPHKRYIRHPKSISPPAEPVQSEAGAGAEQSTEARPTGEASTADAPVVTPNKAIVPVTTATTVPVNDPLLCQFKPLSAATVATAITVPTVVTAPTVSPVITPQQLHYSFPKSSDTSTKINYNLGSDRLAFESIPHNKIIIDLVLKIKNDIKGLHDRIADMQSEIKRCQTEIHGKGEQMYVAQQSLRGTIHAWKLWRNSCEEARQ